MSELFCHSLILKAFFVLLSIYFSVSVPISNDILERFANDLVINECALPEQIQLPFNNTNPGIQNIFSYLKICQNFDTTKRSKEASILCEEILDNLKNISCTNKLATLPEISVPFSKQVCEDIGSLHMVAQENDKSLLKRLTDKFMCDIMCEDEFENACRVLLWSHLVQAYIADFQHSGKLQENNPDRNKIITVDDTQTLEDSTKLATQTEVKTGKGIPNEVSQANEVDSLEPIIPSTNQVKAETRAPKKSTGKTYPLAAGEIDKEPQDPTKPVETSGNLKSSNADVVKTIISQHASTSLAIKPGTKSNATSGTDSSNVQTAGETQGTVASQNNTTILNKEDSSPNTGTNTPQMNKSHKNNIEVGNDQNNKDLVAGTAPSDGMSNVKAEENEEQINMPKDEENEIKKSNPQGLKANQIGSTIGDKTVNNQPESVVSEQASTVSKVSEKPQTVQGTSNVAVKAVDTKPADLPAEKEPQEQMVTEPKDATPVPEATSMEADGSLNTVQTEGTIALEKMEDDIDVHQPSNKDTEQYNLENNEGEEEEYSRRDYEDGFFEETKTKESNPSASNPVTLPKTVVDEDEKIYNNEYPPRESFDRRPGDIPLIAGFPEQEDSHFFFYFLSIVLILMAGYLIFHNKQKIIALIVEGRHERRRRSHGVGYKKLETK